MPTTTGRSPDIVFIVLDTHRLDRLGCYGYKRNTSPNIDAFAQEARVFDSAISPAQWTIPVHASWFSGETPSTHMTVQSGDILDTRYRTLAERMRDRGYRTVGFCNNPLVGVVNKYQLKEIHGIFEPLSRSWRGQYQSLAKAIVGAYAEWQNTQS